MVENSARVSCGNYLAARLTYEPNTAQQVSNSELLSNNRTRVYQEEPAEQEPARTQR